MAVYGYVTISEFQTEVSKRNLLGCSKHNCLSAWTKLDWFLLLLLLLLRCMRCMRCMRLLLCLFMLLLLLLCITSSSGGFPLMLSMWYVVIDGNACCRLTLLPLSICMCFHNLQCCSLFDITSESSLGDLEVGSMHSLTVPLVCWCTEPRVDRCFAPLLF